MAVDDATSKVPQALCGVSSTEGMPHELVPPQEPKTRELSEPFVSISGAIFFRKPEDNAVVVGPVPVKRLKVLIVEGKTRPEYEISVDGQHWVSASAGSGSWIARGTPSEIRRATDFSSSRAMTKILT